MHTPVPGAVPRCIVVVVGGFESRDDDRCSRCVEMQDGPRATDGRDGTTQAARPPIQLSFTSLIDNDNSLAAAEPGRSRAMTWPRSLLVTRK